MPLPPTAPSEAAVLDALRAVQDPDLHRDIVALGFVKDLRICGGNVAFQIELTTPACPVKDLMRSQAERAVRAVPGVTQVQVEMTARVTASRPVLGDKGTIPGVKNVIAVSSGKGGVGKSTVAVNLACALQRTGARVGILDADVYGPNVPLMLGATGQPTVVDKKIVPFQRHGLQVMSMALLVAEDQPVIWRGPMLHSAVRQFLFDVAWSDLDYLVVDLPPGTGDVALSLGQKLPNAEVIVVTTPQQASAEVAERAGTMASMLDQKVIGVVENMAYLEVACPHCGESHRVDVFGTGGGAEVAGTLSTRLGYEVPLLAEVPMDPALASGGDLGVPLVATAPERPAAAAIMALAGRLAARKRNLAGLKLGLTPVSQG